MDTLLTFLQTEYIKNLDGRLKFLLAEYSTEDIINHIIEWLETDRVNYFDATTFARDFYIGSDLTEEEKEQFYVELKRQGFFNQLSRFLYSENFSICSWTIYTIGKFSDPENATLLETAYERYYALKNPILSYRCLSELNWLRSEKADQYLKGLEADESLASKLILLYYWEPFSGGSQFKILLEDEQLVHFIIPDITVAERDEIIPERLFHLENHLFELYNSTGYIHLDKHDFENAARAYFRNYA